MTDREGTPLGVIVSRADDHDVKFLLQRVLLAFPRIGGASGRPRELPRLVRADQGYTSIDLLGLLELCGVRAEIPQRGKDSPAGLGRFRWPVERTIAWLKQYRRVGVRRDRDDATYESFVALACAMIAYKKLAF